MASEMTSMVEMPVDQTQKYLANLCNEEKQKVVKTTLCMKIGQWWRLRRLNLIKTLKNIFVSAQMGERELELRVIFVDNTVIDGDTQIFMDSVISDQTEVFKLCLEMTQHDEWGVFDSFYVYPEMPIEVVKTIFSTRLKVPQSLCQLSLYSGDLRDEDTLKKIGITEEDVIEVSIREGEENYCMNALESPDWPHPPTADVRPDSDL